MKRDRLKNILFEDLIDFAKIAESDDVSSYLYKYNDLYYLAIAYSDSILNSNDVKDQHFC